MTYEIVANLEDNIEKEYEFMYLVYGITDDGRGHILESICNTPELAEQERKELLDGWYENAYIRKMKDVK